MFQVLCLRTDPKLIGTLIQVLFCNLFTCVFVNTAIQVLFCDLFTCVFVNTAIQVLFCDLFTCVFVNTAIKVLFCNLFTWVFPLRLSFLSLDSTLRCKAALVFFWFHHTVLWILFCFMWTHRQFNLFIWNSSRNSFTYLVVSVFMSKVGSLLELTVKFWIPVFFVSESQIESVCQQIKVSSLQKESVTAVFKFSLAVTSTVVGQTVIVLRASHLSWKEAPRPLEMVLQLWDCLAVDTQVPLAWSHKLLTLSHAFL